MLPMLATVAAIPEGPGWTFEVKWDGMRLLARCGGGALRLTSRRGSDVTAQFPELEPLRDLARTMVLDGEIVALDAVGHPDFERLTTRFGVRSRRRAAQLAAAVPVTYVVFDLLEIDGTPLLDEPLRRRRELLADVDLPTGCCTVSREYDDGAALAGATAQRGMEGIVAKRLDSAYTPGVRSRDWIKHSHRSAADALVVGWRGTSTQIATLALAQQEPGGGLRFRGSAGSGLSAAKSRVLLQALRDAALPSPTAMAGFTDDDLDAMREFTWVHPRAVVEIDALGMTAGGRFRQPVVRRVRPDLTASSGGVPAATGGGSRAGWGRGRPQDATTVEVGGRTLRVNNLDKVLYPATGTTKAEVMRYYLTVAPHLLALAHDRPITRRRWPDGVEAGSFFEKNLPKWAPEWIRRVSITGRESQVAYPVLAQHDVGGLMWLAAHSALELHTPQWRVDADGRPLPADRLVVDLDPGAPAGLPECVEVALLIRARLAADGFDVRPVLSGSKGLHLYADIPAARGAGADVTSDAALHAAGGAAEYMRAVATQAARSRPDLVVATMDRAMRSGRVFVDWSQNRAAKTTLAPWSLRGTAAPCAALPLTWDAVTAPGLRQLQINEVLAELDAGTLPLPW